MTNRQKCEMEGIYEQDEIMDAYGSEICAFCCQKLISDKLPAEPICDGQSCEDALELWLEKEDD